MKKQKISRLLLFISLISIGVFLNRRFQWTSYLSNSKNLSEITDFVYDNYILSVFLYLVFAILGSSILALPGVTFAVVSSGLFGPWLGSLYCLIGTSIGAIFSFLLSRYLLKDIIEGLLVKKKKLYDILFKVDKDREILILMITRLLPIFPFNLQNFAYGITNISLGIYSLGTFLFMIPGILIFSLGTEGLVNKESRLTMFIISIIILGFMVAIGRKLHKKYRMLIVEEKDER